MRSSYIHAWSANETTPNWNAPRRTKWSQTKACNAKSSGVMRALLGYFATQGSKAGTGPKGYYRCRQIIATNLGKNRLTRHRSALPANLTSSRPRSWSLGNATLVVAERSGWRRVLGASKPRPSAKGTHPYRQRACFEVLSLATTKLTQRGTGYPSWGHPTQLRTSTGSTGLIHKWQLRWARGQWIQV